MRECTNLRFPNLARTLVAGSGALVAESAVGLELALLLGDLAGLLADEGRGDGESRAGRRGGELLTLNDAA